MKLFVGLDIPLNSTSVCVVDDVGKVVSEGSTLSDPDAVTRVGRKRVERLMKAEGRAGVSRRKGRRTTLRDDRVRPASDLVDRNFRADAPDRLWVADIAYVPTWAGFLYLAVVLDAFSRRIVGWAMGSDLRTRLVLDALDMALGQRQPAGVIHHSDQGSQYTSVAFGLRCREAGVRPSLGSVGDAYDNAMCESFFATLECELLDRRRFQTKAEARMAVFQFIEGWYNPGRRHSALGYLSPVNYEKAALQRPIDRKPLTVHKTGGTPMCDCGNRVGSRAAREMSPIHPGARAASSMQDLGPGQGARPDIS